jgi:hypothetical protein
MITLANRSVLYTRSKKTVTKEVAKKESLKKAAKASNEKQ